MNRFRLHQRIGDFDTLGVAKLPDHQLVFHKRGGDDSGKCTVIKDIGHDVWGVLVGIDEEQKRKLDYFEGVGHGYSVVYLDVELQNQSLSALLYQAELNAMDDGLQPFDWYKAFVLSGARQHNLPADYVQMIEQIKSIRDPDIDRMQLNLDIRNGNY